MTMNGDTSQTAVDCPLGFVAVLSPNADSTAEETLRRILPDIAAGPYHWHSIPGLAMAVRDDNISISLTSGNERDVVLLGHVVSECVGPDDALPWAVSAVAEGRYGELKRLQGVFALIVVDWAKRTVTVVSDLLGIQPFYLARREGVTILSDRAEVAAKIVGPKIDRVGFATWLYFGAPLVDRTLFDSVYRVSPATATVVEGSGVRKHAYWAPVADEQKITQEQLMDELCDEFAASVSRLLAPYDCATVLLSGGFDSRFALLTALREGGHAIDAITVPYTEAERSIVDDLVSMTGIQCQRVRISGALWDEFDSMWFRHGDGYAVTKNLTHLCVTNREAKGPFIDGSIASVSVWCHTADPEVGPPANKRDAQEFVWKAHGKSCPTFCFRKDVLRRLESIARQGADEQSDALGWDSKFCLKWDMYQDERRFTSVNFLQYADLAPSVQPFYDRALIERRLKHSNKLFNKDFYHGMLKRRFPGTGDLPHSSDLPKGKDTVYAFSRTLWRHLPELVLFIRRNRNVLNVSWLIPRVSTYGLGWKKHMYVVLQLMRLMKMESELKRQGIAQDLSELIFGLEYI